MRIVGIFSIAAPLVAWAQVAGLTLPPDGGSQRASVSQNIGPVLVSIDYSSPRVHAPDGGDRRGKIWGKLVPYGLNDLGFGPSKAAPWRAGADRNTVFTVSHAVTINGQALAAGSYGLHIIVGPDEWTVIFSNNATSWGSFFYNPAEDALRVKVKPRAADYREWLTYDFPVRKETEAVAELRWEDLAVSWTVAVPDSNEIYMTELRKELRTVPGFQWQSFVAASQFAAKTQHLAEALDWAEAAVSRPFVGQRNFATLTNKANVLYAAQRQTESKALLAEAIALPGVTVFQIHQLARSLQMAKREKEAAEVFRLNAEKHGDAWPVNVGLARAAMIEGDQAKALEYAKKALTQAPDPGNKLNLERMVEALAAGKSFSND